MKTIAVVANDKEFAEYIGNDLNKYLKSYAKVRCYSIEDLEKIDKLREDVILLSAYTIFLKIKSKISDDSVLQNFSQTLSTDNAAALREAYDSEPFDRAYLVNIDYRFCTSVIMELYEAGFQYIDFVPYFGDSMQLDERINIAVTPDEEALVPSGVSRVINIGQRVTDVECVIELCEKLGINPREVLSTESSKEALDHIADKRRIAKPLMKGSGDKGRRVYGGTHDARFNFSNIIGDSEVIKEKISIARRMAGSDASVLITGESGTGKEVFAQSIHNSSYRKDYNFVAINCAAIPENLFESELFGYDEGAFSGAKRSGKAGYFELAHKGTLFLDEIGEMPLMLQGKLLRAIEERRIARVGSSKLIDIDVRIIAATNQKLEELVREKKFRSDLYFRLNVLPLSIPPLIEGKEDILPILYYLRDMGEGVWDLSYETKAYLENYTWPGNIRELRNVVQYLDSLGLRNIEKHDLPPLIGTAMKTNSRSEDEPIGINISQSIKPTHVGGQEFIDFILLEGRNLDLFAKTLSVMDDAYERGLTLGRKQIAEALNDQEEIYTEAEVRNALRKLSEQGFIRSDRGRGGSKLLDKGRRLLSELKGLNG